MEAAQEGEAGMSETRNSEPGWPEWADTPEKRERNRQAWQKHNERVRHTRTLLRIGRFRIWYLPRKYR